MKQKIPEISVIISCFNQGKWITRCIRSLSNQNNINKSDFELVVINDGSKDNSDSIIKGLQKYYSFKYIHNKVNKGLPYSLNAGINKSIGRFVVRVDSDDFVKRNFLTLLRYFLNQNPHYQAVSCDYLTVDKNETVKKRFNSRKKEIACGIMYRRECLYDIGLFNIKFKMREGHDLNQRFRKKYNIGHLEIPLYKYRDHDENRTKKTKILRKYDKKLKQKYK